MLIICHGPAHEQHSERVLLNFPLPSCRGGAGHDAMASTLGGGDGVDEGCGASGVGLPRGDLGQGRGPVDGADPARGAQEAPGLLRRRAGGGRGLRRHGPRAARLMQGCGRNQLVAILMNKG